MPIVLIERYDSRSLQVQRYAMTSTEVVLVAVGSEDEEAVRLVVEANLPETWRHEGWPESWQLVLEGYRIDHVGGGVYEVKATYSSRTDPEWTYETVGGTAKITQSKEVRDFWPTASEDGSVKDAPDFNGAIGVDSDSVQGCEVTVPVFRFTATVRVPAEVVTLEYLRNVYLLTGTTNEAEFRGFPAGEVLFLGLTGTQRGAEKAALTFHFVASPNVEEYYVHGMGPVEKRGHDYVWFRYADKIEVDGDGNEVAVVKWPVAMYVERVYDEGDFTLLGLGGEAGEEQGEGS